MEELATIFPADDRDQALALVDDLLATLETEIVRSRRAGVLCRVADVYERRLVDANSALITLQTAFREDPASGQVVHAMEHLARTYDKWRDVIAATIEVADSMEDAKAAADLWAQVAFWCDVGLGSSDE